MNRFDLILAVILVCVLWAVGSWYWYTCDINDACEGVGLQSAWIGGAWQGNNSEEDTEEIIPVNHRESVPVRDSARNANN